jgi:hypothetical protein
MDQRSSTCIENTLHNQESKAVVNTYEPPCNFVLVPISLVAIVNFVITRYIVLSGGVENAQGAECARASNKEKAPTATPTGSSWPPPTVSKALPKANVRIIYGFRSPSLLSMDSPALHRQHMILLVKNSSIEPKISKHVEGFILFRRKVSIESKA